MGRVATIKTAGHLNFVVDVPEYLSRWNTFFGEHRRGFSVCDRPEVPQLHVRLEPFSSGNV
jgi:hypothetical protein